MDPREQSRRRLRGGLTQNVSVGRTLEMPLDGTDLASADGATNRTSLLVLRSRPRLVPEKYFPAGFALRRPDAGGHVRPRIRKTLLHEGASDGVESCANIYKRRSTSTLSIQTRSTVLHASFEKTKMDPK